ncbi:diguanylate cyclase [Massilia eburnea]|uniref:ligand-binding sensor domain-containing diguanylate cyclase n=1 Tax=Massilia eburnea TaxID=1776165 RepID=UPI003D6B73BD
MRFNLIQSLLSAVLALATLDASAQHIPLQHFGQSEGLGNLSVTALSQDASGYLWAGTENGLYRYNGAAFRRYGIAQGMTDPFVTALHSGSNGALWIGNHENLYRLNQDRLVPVLWNGEKIPVWPFQPMAEGANGDLLLASEGRVLVVAVKGDSTSIRHYFDPATLKAHPELQEVRSIYTDSKGTLWMACKESLCQSSEGRIRVLGEAEGLPRDEWSSIAIDKDGNLWTRSAQHIFTLPKGATRFENRTPPPDMMRKHMLRSELHIDDNGNVLTNADPGLLRWRQGRWESYGKENGLVAAGGVTAILHDRGHGTWLATRGRGLQHWLGYGNWENWTAQQGLPDDVIITARRDRQGALHIGTRSGHAMLAPGSNKFTTPTTPPALASQQWASMDIDRSGRLWAGSYSGMLMRYLPDSGKTELVATLPFITQVLADRNDQMWLTTWKGVYVLPANAAAGTQPQLVKMPGMSGRHPENPVGAGCIDRQGHLWLPSVTDVLHYDGKAWKVLPFGQTMGRATFDGITCSRDGDLWAAAGGTLWKLKAQDKPSATRIETPVLRERSVYSTFEDSRGWLWVATGAGMAVWNRDRWRMLNQTHGLAWNDLNGLGFYEDQDGSMWITTSNGLSHLLHPETLFDTGSLPVVIEEARRGSTALAPGAVQLPWSREPLVFRLASLQFEGRQGLHYRYRLAGMEDQWNELAQPEMRYAGLPAGDYRFQAVAVDSDSGTQSRPAELAFSIAPPWWRSYPFYVLCAAGVMLGFLLFHRMRLLVHKRREAELEVMVQERTRALEEAQEALKVRALKDALTRTWNRGAMMEILEREIGKSQRTGESFVLVLLDLDKFKNINDTHGHLAGDAVLVETARRLIATVRTYDSVGRYGGEEFLVLLPGLSLPAGANRIEALHQAIRSEPVEIGGETGLPVTASFGVVAFKPHSQASATDLLHRADLALYRSKNEGRDRISYAEETMQT